MKQEKNHDPQPTEVQKTKNLSLELTEVWGDRVSLNHLFKASLVGIFLTMTFYMLGDLVFVKNMDLNEGIAKGYSLMTGIGGCILSVILSAHLFKPKRTINEKKESFDLEAILKEADLSFEEEIEALDRAKPDLIEELERLNLYDLLALIPENSKNYKPSYKKLAKEGEK